MRTWSVISPEMALRNRLGKKRKILAVTLKKVLRTPLPLYLALLLAINVGILTAAGGYLLLTRGSSTQDPENLVKDVKAEVLPAEGYITSITWGDTGKKLIEVGAIDEKQYQQLFNSPTNGMDELDILKGGSTKPIGINENNSQFVVDTLWAFALTQKSKVLAEGPVEVGKRIPNQTKKQQRAGPAERFPTGPGEENRRKHLPPLLRQPHLFSRLQSRNGGAWFNRIGSRRGTF